MDSVVIGKRIREVRGDECVESFAASIGVSTSAVFMYERGERIPRDEVKCRIAKRANMTVQEIFFD